MCGSLLKTGAFAFLLLALTTCVQPTAREVSPELERLLEQALELERRGEDHAAGHLLRELTSTDPAYVPAQLALARLVERLSGPAAVEDRASELGRDPRTAPIAMLLLAERETDPASQRGLLERAVELDPRLVQAWTRLGRHHQELGDFAAAERCYARAESLDPNSASLCVELGMCCFRQFRWPEAVAWARRALELDPQHPRALLFVAVDHLIRRDYLSAIEQFRRYREATPPATRVREERGVSVLAYRGALSRMRAANEIESGLGLAHEAVEVFPDSGLLRDYLGHFVERTGDLAGGEACYREALRRDPYAMKPMQSLRRLLVRHGRFEEAHRIWRRIVPYSLVVRGDNELAPRFLALERAILRVPQGAGASPADLRELARAMAAVGWCEEAISLYAQLDGDASVAAEASALRRTWTFLERLRARMSEHYRAVERGTSTLDMAGLIHWIQQNWPGEGAPDLERDLDTYFVVVREVNPFRRAAGSLSEVLGRYNLMVDCGDNAGHVDLRVSRQLFRGRCEHRVGALPYRYTPVVTDETLIDTYLAHLSGHSRISGRAFLSRQGFYVAIDAFRPGRNELIRFLRPPRTQVRATERVGYDPDLDAGLRRRFLASEGIAYPDATPTAETLDRTFEAYLRGYAHNVWMHELGHLVDFEKYLPFGDHVAANLAVSLGCGLSPANIVMRFERVAETFSLATTRYPYLSLQDNLERLELDPSSLYYVVLVAWQKQDPRQSPYYRGACKIFEALLDEAERRGPAGLAKLAELSEDEIRRIARAECRREGIPFLDGR